MLRVAAVSSRHRRAAETFMLEAEDVSFSGSWRLLDWPAPFCSLAALAVLPAFYRVQRAWAG